MTYGAVHGRWLDVTQTSAVRGRPLDSGGAEAAEVVDLCRKHGAPTPGKTRADQFLGEEMG